MLKYCSTNIRSVTKSLQGTKVATPNWSMKIFSETCAKFTGKYCYRGLFFNKIAGWSPAAILKRDSGAGVFL